ncbi:glycoside hydrolase family 43 protein [Streptomyces sp. NBC_01775]|uniref:glycoside hydrolase family 43 protein n=1 Tax=Streptomyces sp. NBC_01775 TaxID=2975939 RepID=UPI002DD90E2F|nr:glycoside hydrolase family 43 protein [Streptomyces sp. NBC_01775]WSB74591.1 glycoside hydrolase family 43 protein [Streptomyces sp. NBC_01775]
MSRENTPARRLVLKGALGVGTAAALGTATPAHARSGRPAPGRRDDKAAALSVDPPYVNPLVRQRADPHIVRHTDGSYYFTATVPEYDRIVLRRAATLNGLADAGESVIWRRHDSGEMAAHIWAPEIHFIDGAWYVYFAAGRSDDVWAIRMYVLENTSADPFTGTWTERGRITTAWDSFSLDATTFVHGGTRYLAWAQRDPSQNNNSDLYLSAMDSPWAVTGPQVRLSRPELPWETVGFAVNEGPSVLQRNGRVFLSYSASATDANYCMGLLTARDSAELLDPASWSKSPEPVFTSDDGTSQYGPGHNSFTVGEDGTTDVLVYHARQYKEIEGDPLDDPNRHTRVQPLGWKADGTPDFGTPVADTRVPR